MLNLDEGLLRIVRQQLTHAVEREAERDNVGAIFHQWLAAEWLAIVVAGQPA